MTVSAIALFGTSIAAGAASVYLEKSGVDKHHESSARPVDGNASGLEADLASKKKASQSKNEKQEDGDTETVTEEKKIPYDKTTVVTDDLLQGVSQVLKPGVEGLVKITYRITYRENLSPLKVEIGRTTISLPVTQVTAVGTRVDPGTDPAPSEQPAGPVDPTEPSPCVEEDTCVENPDPADPPDIIDGDNFEPL